MFCLASKYQRASQNFYKSALVVDRYKPQSIIVARIPMILCKDKSGKGGSKKQIMYKPYVKPAFMDHDYKNMKLKRPISPHLQIYGPTLPAMTSIAQRATGVIITFEALILSGSALFLSNGVDSLVSAIQSLKLGGFTVFLLKLILAAPFCYHYLNGIRFVAFNAVKWLSMKEVYTTAQRAMIGAGILALLFAIL